MTIMSGNTQQHPLSSDARRRRRGILLPLILAWPVVGAMGALLSYFFASPPLAAMLPMLWLLILAFVIERMHTPSA